MLQITGAFMLLLRWDTKETLLLASFPIISKKRDFLVKTRTYFATHLVAGEATKDHVLNGGPAQSQLRPGSGPLSSACRREKKKPSDFDLPFACKGVILANEKAKGFLQTAFYGPVLFSHPDFPLLPLTTKPRHLQSR